MSEFLYVPNSGDNTVSVIDTSTNMVVATILVGGHPDTAAATPDGAFVYVTSESGVVSVISTASNTIVETIAVESSGQIQVAISPDGTIAYVTSRASGRVSVIDTASQSVVATINVGGDSYGVAFTPDGNHAYITNGSNTVSVIDTGSNSVIANINVGNVPTMVAVSPDGTHVYVNNYVSGTVSVIDVASNTVTTTINVGGNPYGIVISPDGTHAYVATYSGTVSVIDIASNLVVASIDAGPAVGIAISHDGTHLYVTHYASSNTVSVIDTATNTVVDTINVGSIAEYPAIVSVNDHPPVITTDAVQSVEENTTTVAALTSTDADNVGTNPATFSITGGTDAALFDIIGGDLVFKSAKDFETDPHSYQVAISAFDGTNTTTELITVNLTNVAGAIINGTSGNNTINATTTVAGQPLPTNEEDTINGGAGRDTINALGGNDFINGGTGADTMFGGTGNDTYVVDDKRDVANETGGDGSDLVQSSITFSLSDASHAIGAIENLMLTGTANINGTGNALANEIIGNSGNNILNGLGGADILTGGQGSDKFVFTAAAHSTPGASDLITDFVSGSDIFDFSKIDANASKGGNQAFAFGGQNENVVANSVTWSEDLVNGNTIVQADVNGNTTADLQIVLVGTNLNLHATDFIL